MIKLLLYVVLVLVLGFGFAWLADRPGDMLITWQGQQIEMSLMVAVALVVALIAAILILWWLVRTIVTSPHILKRHFRARRRDRGYQALSTGLIAAGAGDAITARKMHKRTRGLISAGQEPLIHLLEAQTALIEGDHASARAKFEAMADDPETRALALRGLYLEARRLGADEAARQYAERAVDAAPQLPWAAQATLEHRGREGDWDGALRLLEKQRMARVLKREDADRKKAVLLTARAMERIDGDFRGAQTDAMEALRLAPDFVPASIVAAKALFREDNLRKGSRILEKTWRLEPHPEVAETYVRARIGDSVNDRLKRAEKLEGLKPNHIESLLVVAHAALDAQQFSKAREKAEAAARLESRESIYLLLADIEEAETGDQGRVRHWLSQAVRAQRDPAWTADGYVAEKWAAVSPVTGKLDAFEWRVPVARLGGPVEEGESARTDAEKAIRTLPPVREEPVSRPPENALTVDAEEVEEKPAEVASPQPAREPGSPPAAAHEEHKTVPASAARSANGQTDPASLAGRGEEQARVEAARPSPAPAAGPAGGEAPEKPDEPLRSEAQKPAPSTEGETKAGARKGDGDGTDAAAFDRPASRERPVPPAPKEQRRADNTDSATFRRPPDDPGIDEAEVATARRKRFGLF